MGSLSRDDDPLRARIRRLEERLAELEREIDAARGEMASADVDVATLREVASLSRELRGLRAKLDTP